MAVVVRRIFSEDIRNIFVFVTYIMYNIIITYNVYFVLVGPAEVPARWLLKDLKYSFVLRLWHRRMRTELIKFVTLFTEVVQVELCLQDRIYNI